MPATEEMYDVPLYKAMQERTKQLDKTLKNDCTPSNLDWAGQHDQLVEFEAGLGALEIEARRQLAIRLVDGIGQLVLVDFGDHIK